MSSSAVDASPPSLTPDEAAIARSQVPLIQQPGPKLLFAGLLFASLSALSTRRAIFRRRIQAPETQHLTSPPRVPHNPAIQTRQSASDSVLSKGQTSSPSTPSGGQGTAAPGYAPAASESVQAASQSVPNAAAETMNPTVAKLQNSPLLMAAEALSLATINVFSWGMVGVGGALWSWDIRNMEEMRRKVRGGQFEGGTSRSEQEVEEELEDWIVNVLARREDKERVKEKLKSSRGGD